MWSWLPLAISALSTLGANVVVDASARRSMSFEEAIGLAARAPLVAGTAAAATKKRAADRGVSALTLNPQFTLQPGYRLLTSQDREPEFIGDVVLALNLSGHSSARRRTMRDEEEMLDAEAVATALSQRLGAARAWIDLWAAERVLEEAVREEGLAGEFEALVEKAAALGSATRADVAEARAYRAEARLLVLSTEGERFDNGLGLARETGASPGGPLLLARGALPDAPLPSPLEQQRFLDRVEGLPAVRAAALRVRAERAREQEEKAARGWWAHFGVAVQRDAPGGLVVGGLARFGPPLFDRGERERAVMAAAAERLEGEHKNAAHVAAVELAMAFHEVEHTGEVLTELEQRLVPASREAATLRETIYRAGESTLLEVVQARRNAVAAASRLQRARGAHAWAVLKTSLLLSSVGSDGASSGSPGAAPSDGGRP